VLNSRDVAFWEAYQRVEFENISRVILALMGVEPQYTVEDPMPVAEIQDNLSMYMAAKRGNNSKT
jgi:hypothetical protein